MPRLSDALRDVAAGVLTPFDETGDVRYDHLRENVRDLRAAGVDLLLANANISEYHSLTHEERIAVTEATVEAAGDATVLAGVGGSTGTATDLVAAFDDLGVDAVMVMPPMHTYKHERGLLRWYEDIAERAAAPTVPYVRGYDPSVEFLASLARLDGVVGVKYAVDDVALFRRAVLAGDDDVVWINGMAEVPAPALWLEGAEGFTAGVSNFLPELGRRLFDALSAGDYERARTLRDLALPFQAFRGETGSGNRFPAAVSVPAVKAGLDAAGFHGGDVREPLVGLTDADRERAEWLVADAREGLDALPRRRY